MAAVPAQPGKGTLPDSRRSASRSPTTTGVISCVLLVGAMQWVSREFVWVRVWGESTDQLADGNPGWPRNAPPRNQRTVPTRPVSRALPPEAATTASVKQGVIVGASSSFRTTTVPVAREAPLQSDVGTWAAERWAEASSQGSPADDAVLFLVRPSVAHSGSFRHRVSMHRAQSAAMQRRSHNNVLACKPARHGR
jgi:hypothetical protein